MIFNKEDKAGIGILTFLVGILVLLCLLTFCDKAHSAEWCFSETQSQDLCVLMERHDSYKEQVQICLAANSELEQENLLLKQNYRLSSENLKIEQEIIKTLRERIILMDKQCDKRVGAAKPSFWYKLGLFTEGVITGGVIALIGVMLL